MKTWTRLGATRVFGLALLLAVSLLGTMQLEARAAAARAVDPRIFRLPLSAYPSGSTVILSEVESNAKIEANRGAFHLGSLSWQAEGRLTGYFQALHVPFKDTKGARHQVLLTQSASVFASHRRAAAAWTHERAAWLSNKPTGDSCNTKFPVGAKTVGQRGFGCATGLATSHGYLVELYFVRGRFFIQLSVGFALQDFNIYRETVVLPALNLADRLSSRLDAIAKTA
jgi:hypothetical protein